MKKRPILIAICLLLVTIGLTLHYEISDHPSPTPSVSPDRREASQPLAGTPASNPVEPPVCQDFFHAVCKKRGETRDPTGTVNTDVEGEVQALRLYEEIIHQHPDWSSDKVDEELVTSIYTPKRRNRLIAAFQLVQSSIARFIDRQPETVFTKKEKKILKTRIKETIIELPPPAAIYADEPDLYTKNDVYYERTPEGKKRLRVGGAYLLSVKSWFNLLFTVAHELGHSIDPCEMKSVDMTLPAYGRLGACFEREKLTAAGKGPSFRECGEKDQLSETFADWLAVQVTAESLKTFSTEFHPSQVLNAASNAVRDICEQDESRIESSDGPEPFQPINDEEVHPSPQIRIEGIFAGNPSIRSVLGCVTPPRQVYCELDTPLPSALPSPTSTSGPVPGAHP